MSSTTELTDDDRKILLGVRTLKSDSRLIGIMQGLISLVVTSSHDDTTIDESTTNADTHDISLYPSDLSSLHPYDDSTYKDLMEDDLFSVNDKEIPTSPVVNHYRSEEPDGAAEHRQEASRNEWTPILPSVIESDGFILPSNLSRCSVIMKSNTTNDYMKNTLTSEFRVFTATNYPRRVIRNEDLKTMVYERFLKEQYPLMSIEEMPELEFVTKVKDRVKGIRYKKMSDEERDVAVHNYIKNKKALCDIETKEDLQNDINFRREQLDMRKSTTDIVHYHFYLGVLSNAENNIIKAFPTDDRTTLQLYSKVLESIWKLLFPSPKNEAQPAQSSKSSLDPDLVETNDKKRSSQNHKPGGNAKKQNNGPRGPTTGASGSRNDGAAAAAAAGMEFPGDQQVLGLKLQYMDQPDRTSALDSDCSALGSDWNKDFDDDYNSESGNDNDGDLNRNLKLLLETSNNEKHIVSEEVETIESSDQHREVGVDSTSAGNFANDRKVSLSQQPHHRSSSSMKSRAAYLESNESESVDSCRNNVDCLGTGGASSENRASNSSIRCKVVVPRNQLLYKSSISSDKCSSTRSNSFTSGQYFGTAHPAHPNDIDKSEHVKVVHSTKLDEMSCLRAAFNGDLQQLKHAHEKGCPWDERTCSYAASVGHLDCLQYAHEHGCPWDKTTCENAASGGHLDCLTFAHENGCPWDERTCSNAALHGHLECLQYSHNNGCPWYEATCSSAAIRGHLNCLKFAHDNGCPWDETTCANAASGGHLSCLQFARRNGCPWGKRTCSSAALMGHLDCLKFAHKNGCPWDEITCISAAKRGHHDCLQYARDNGCPWDQKAKHASREDASTTIGTRTCSDRESMVYQQRSISKFLKSVCRFKKNETTRYCATNTKH